MREPNPLHNITRYSKGASSFSGWRVSICRQQCQFSRYFSDQQYGGKEEALRMSIKIRDSIFKNLSQGRVDVKALFKHYKSISLGMQLPKGLRARRVPQPTESSPF